MKTMNFFFDVYYGIEEIRGYWAISFKEKVMQQLFFTLEEGMDVFFLDKLSTTENPFPKGVRTKNPKKAGKILFGHNSNLDFFDVFFDPISRFWLCAKNDFGDFDRIKLEFGRPILISPEMKEKIVEMKKCGKIYFPD